MNKRSAIVSCLLPACLLIIFYSFIYCGNPGKYDGAVLTESGYVSGVKSNSGEVISYKGIPFAAPPVGVLRWRSPRPAIPWKGIKKCDSFGPSPMQGKPVPFMVYTPEFLIPDSPISEDCLYLNIWTRARYNEKKPVFVWIYGGGFVSGGTAVPIYDGEALAKKGIIFVSVNYRVGVFGFLAHPDLTNEAPEKSSGNYGILDQIAALRWIRKNIGAFGGDPDNITIAGQSAGSMIVNCLVASPAARGLFNKAISESGSMLIDKTVSLQEAEKQGLDLARAMSAGSIKELRNIPASDLMKFSGRYWPIVDGHVLPKPVSSIFKEGLENHVPVLTGWNADESFVNDFKTKEVFQKDAREKYGTVADEFLKYYPANTDDEAISSQMKLSRDMIFAISGFKWAAVQSGRQNSPVYLYYFSRKLPAKGDFIKYGAFHTGEVAYIMDNLKFLHRPWKPEDFRLAKLMSDYWVNFITGSDPNGNGLPEWPKFNTQNYQAMVFDTISSAQTIPDKNELSFMVSVLDK